MGECGRGDVSERNKTEKKMRKRKKRGERGYTKMSGNMIFFENANRKSGNMCINMEDERVVDL